MLSYRAFKRALTSPMLFQFELLLTLQIIDALKEEEDSEFWKFWLNKFNMLGLLATSHFLIHRTRVFLNKLVYIIVSFATAFKNKKQRIKNQWICFLLQLTLLMPYFGAVLLWTTIFDVATIPTFGFAFFTAGYLKPQRMWSVISPVEANPNQKVSDAHLYQSMQGQINKQIREMMLKDPANFEAGFFYLMKNMKMIILVQVLERADGFIVFTTKCSELQETTICHAQENEHINEVISEVFNPNPDQAKTCVDPQILFSLSPIR